MTQGVSDGGFDVTNSAILDPKCEWLRNFGIKDVKQFCNTIGAKRTFGGRPPLMIQGGIALGERSGRTGSRPFQVFSRPWPNTLSMSADIRLALAIVNDRDNAPIAAACDMISSNCFPA